MSRRRALARVALALSGLLVTLLGVEAAFRLSRVSVGTVQINRLTVRRSANPRLRFELVPGALAHAEVDYRISSQGMRDAERAEPKPPGLRRVAVVGDSIAFGYWVEERDAVPHQLQDLLQQSGSGPVEVLNFGVPGYNLEQETESLRSHALRFSPDLVVLVFCLNDLQAFSHEYGLVVDRGERRSRFGGRLADALLERSQLAAWVEYRLGQLESRREWVRAQNPLRRGPFPEAGDARAELTSRFGALAEILRAARVPGVVAVVPMFGTRFAGYPYRAVHRTVVESAAEAGVLAVDLLPCFEPYHFRDVRVDVAHPSPLGHRIAAHGILDALCRERLLCPGPPPATLRACTDYRPEEFRSVRGF
jgi:lysophospholipase L1-like esterase